MHTSALRLRGVSKYYKIYEHEGDRRTGTLPDNVIALPYRHTWPSWGREHWAGA